MGSTYRLGVVALATLALWGVAESFLYIARFSWRVASMPSSDWGQLAAPTSFLLLLVPSVLVFRWRERLARRWFGAEDEPGERPQSSHELQSIAFASFGAYVLVTTLPDLVPVAHTLVERAESAPHWPALVATLLRIALAAVLLVRGKRLARLWSARAPV